MTTFSLTASKSFFLFCDKLPLKVDDEIVSWHARLFIS
jgi:hypothetical protein